jgi:hypothetical protein
MFTFEVSFNVQVTLAVKRREMRPLLEMAMKAC